MKSAFAYVKFALRLLAGILMLPPVCAAAWVKYRIFRSEFVRELCMSGVQPEAARKLAGEYSPKRLIAAVKSDKTVYNKKVIHGFAQISKQ